MPCNICQKKVSEACEGCRLRYCYCGACNHCHVGGFCPVGMRWYSQKIVGKQDDRAVREPNQSHGGHHWVPGCNNQQH